MLSPHSHLTRLLFTGGLCRWSLHCSTLGCSFSCHGVVGHTLLHSASCRTYRAYVILSATTRTIFQFPLLRLEHFPAETHDQTLFDISDPGLAKCMNRLSSPLLVSKISSSSAVHLAARASDEDQRETHSSHHPRAPLSTPSLAQVLPNPIAPG